MDDVSQPNAQQVTAEDVKHAIDTKEKCIVLDVRTQEEYERGRIAGSIHVPVDTVESKILTVIPDTSAKIYVYCFSGSRSVYAVDVMTKLGYTNVFDMAHGLLAWRAKQYPVVR
jgi:rhodanese-related sulfurtransferase